LAKILKCWVHNAVKNTTVNTKANTDNNSQQQPKSGAESAKSGEMDEMCRSLTTEGLDRRAPFPAEDCAPIEDKYPW
jgi:hypothetical protein